MPSAAEKLTDCFELIFPKMPRDAVAAATQASVKEWDSVAAITLANVIEEQFEVQIDFDRMADLDSYQKILKYLVEDLHVAP